ncbi:Transporter associated domain-containing protein [Acidaminobacter hydrogenoformans DSM 2784]|uniref:Transporter associated domain-containing protein n=1 Tax=Acidaminobacter hydrogenoformans DSM 2784 TaxID=1120920 RepID=A0A1G5RWI6_9FIRM|nr:Transporter associated domain-containing protein [Acidaminobacter hydrogenoformans DSM 2784]
MEEFETLNGFFISLYGNIPPKGQISQVVFEHLLIQAVDVTDKRIEKMIIQVMDRDDV